MHIVNIMCILSTDAYVMYISFLLLLFAYVHVIRILSEHMDIMRTLSAVVLDIFLPNRQCLCHPYVLLCLRMQNAVPAQPCVGKY